MPEVGEDRILTFGEFAGVEGEWSRGAAEWVDRAGHRALPARFELRGRHGAVSFVDQWRLPGEVERGVDDSANVRGCYVQRRYGLVELAAQPLCLGAEVLLGFEDAGGDL